MSAIGVSRQSAMWRLDGFLRRSRAARMTGQIVIVLLLVAAYSITRLASPAMARQLPSLPDLVSAVGRLLVDPNFWQATGYTAGVAAVGLVLAVVIGATVGALLSLHRNAFGSAHFVIDFLRAIPNIALLPVGLLIIGPNPRMEVTLILLTATFPVLLQVYFAIRNLDPKMLETARSFRLTRMQRVVFIVAPAVSPAVATSVRLAATLSVLIAVGSELLATGSGLGYMVAQAQVNDQIPRLYSLILIIGLLAVALNAGLESAERHLLAWHRREAKGVRV
jgi:ABC-type nitrate/sulfonate/bicarbonate transport system permease component